MVRRSPASQPLHDLPDLGFGMPIATEELRIQVPGPSVERAERSWAREEPKRAKHGFVPGRHGL
jgi:hypothetical protein